MSKSLSKFWLENYVSDDYFCVLCRSKGIVHTEYGRYYCVCPNGRAMHKQSRPTKRAGDLATPRDSKVSGDNTPSA